MDLAKVHESIGEIRATGKALHERLDRTETNIKDRLIAIDSKLEEITTWMHTSKGYMAGAMAVGGIAGAVVAAAFHWLTKT